MHVPLSMLKVDFSQVKGFEKIDKNVKCHYFIIVTYFKCQLRCKKLQAHLSCCPPLSISKLDFRQVKVLRKLIEM